MMGRGSDVAHRIPPSSADTKGCPRGGCSGGPNWYAYVNNDPVNWVDPWGLDVANPGEDWFGLIWPTTGTVTSEFGKRDPIAYTTSAGRRAFTSDFHAGVDVANEEGTPVNAAGHGTVIAAVTDGEGALGNYVTIRHPTGKTTTYAHLDTVYVRAGQPVGQGGQIGAMGNTGASTDPHMHFEVLDTHGNPTDPRSLIPGDPEPTAPPGVAGQGGGGDENPIKNR